jgi:hypothetical protein
MGNESAPSLDPGWLWKRWESRILLAFGLLFFLIGIVLLAREIAFQHDAIIGRGSVVELRVTEGADGPNTSPVVEFKTLEGVPIRFEGAASTQLSSYASESHATSLLLETDDRLLQGILFVSACDQIRQEVPVDLEWA